MPRRESNAKQEGALGRVASAVKRLFGRGRSEAETPAVEAASPSTAARRTRPRTEAVKARPAKREADIPLDVLDRSYSPNRTSSKASFRSDGADHQRDQEFAFTADTDGWNDEDHYTNKSGDPRIGTHRRTYEPGESRLDSRD
jgi:hypothetical protein